LTLDQILNKLEEFGLKRIDAQIYFLLAKQGPLSHLDIIKTLNLMPQQTQRCLQKLQTKGIIYSTFECPVSFYALPPDEALDLLIKKKQQETQEIQQSKKEILALWQSYAPKTQKKPLAK
jgi:sugar-specific transcriptional regulator TrmB